MKVLNKKIMRMNIYPKDEYDMELYNSLILEDEYIIYNPKVEVNTILNKKVSDYATYISGRFERIKVKRDGRRFELNLN